MTSDDIWDVVVVGAGPAGSSAALSALQERPDARVLLLDRSDFPRDKSCGDGVAPHVFDVLRSLGADETVREMQHHHRAVETLELSMGAQGVTRRMRRLALVVPRAQFDARLVDAAVGAGGVLRRHRVRTVDTSSRGVLIDGTIRARVVVAADGARSGVRRSIGLGLPPRMALGLRAYAPTPRSRAGRQVIRFGQDRQPSYAWAFDRGDGWSNVGYGEVLSDRWSTPSHALMVQRVEDLLPGSTSGAHSWLGHHLPLSTARWHQPAGRILLAGDAAGLINPLSGEGIYYAVATGACAGRVAALGATSPPEGQPADPGTAHREGVRRLLRGNLVSTAIAGRMVSKPLVLSAGLRASAADQKVFDDLVELALGPGRLTPRILRGLIRYGRQ
jgi:geranylgeranyl reductase family protein